ncbi:E3 SUMO-protein ligase PIAS2-like isoform X2 [Centroberyx affinis]
MVSSFRVSELQVLLGFAGHNKSGRKHELLLRALHLLKSGCSPAVQTKIKELYRRHYPRTTDTGVPDSAGPKSPLRSAEAGLTVADADISFRGSGPCDSDSDPLTGEAAVLHETKASMNLQQQAPLIPPVHPDVQMKPLPFYDVLDVLIKPSSLGASTVQRYHQEKYFIFALTPQQVREVCISRDFLPGGRRDYMVQIQLRFCLSETSCPQEDNYPNSLCIKVNGKLFPLPGYAPPPKNGVEQKRPGRPLNITSLVRLSSAVPNQISVTWAPEIGKTYSMSVYLVRQLTSPLLLQRLRMKGIRNPDHSRALIKEKLTADPDSEIATTSLRVSLMCPLGKMRLTVPCRAVTCSHLQCFDAALYLQMNEKKPTWICPVCDKKAAYESLIIDGLFMEILNDCSDVDEIKFQEDGTWCPMRPKKEAVKVSSQTLTKIETSTPVRQCSVVPHSAEPSSAKKADVIDLTLESSSSDDDEEDVDPPHKKRCLYMSKSEEMHGKGVLTYQPSTVRVPNVQPLDAPYLTSTLADYAVPFHHSTLATIPTDMQSLDLFSLIQADPQHYRAPMFLDNLTSSLQSAAAASTSTALVSSSNSHYEASAHAAGSNHETRVITGGGGGGGGGGAGSISDIISLD